MGPCHFEQLQKERSGTHVFCTLTAVADIRGGNPFYAKKCNKEECIFWQMKIMLEKLSKKQ